MTEVALLSVQLPDGNVVEVSKTPLTWWVVQDGTGYVPPFLLAPDPNQPRRHINPDRLAELQHSIAERGVREPITVTPLSLAPWAVVEEKYRQAFFLIVSGHRRWTGSELAELGAVPIRIKIYASKKDHYLDASLLNSNRDELTALEEGLELVNLRDQGWTIEELAKNFGMATTQVYNRMYLTKLHPNIQAMLDPALPPKKRLSVTIAGHLGAVKEPTAAELDEVFGVLSDTVSGLDEYYDGSANLDAEGRRFALQRLLLGVIKHRHLQATRAIEFVREQALKLEAVRGAPGRPTERYQPSRRLKIFSTLLKEIVGTVVMDWTPGDFRRLFEGKSYADVDDYVTRITQALDFLEGLKTVLVRIRDTKPKTAPKPQQEVGELREAS